MLLQVNVPAPKVIPPDSLRQATRDIVYQIQNDPDAFWHNLMDSAILFGVKVLAALLIYGIGMWVISWVKKLLKRSFERKKTEPTMASFITSFVTISLTVLFVVIAVSTLGVDTTSLAALLAAGGMAIGMALSGTVQNFAGGIMLLAFKPFKAGDMIQAQGILGKVVEVHITSTKVLTPDNRVVILPNGALSNGTIENFAGRPLRRLEWKVSVAYGTNAEACKRDILDILCADNRILREDTDMNALYDEVNIKRYQLSTVAYRMDAIPAPFVGLMSLNSSDITFVVRAWVRGDDYWDVFFDLQERFYTELPKRGYSFAFPRMDVSMLEHKV